MANEAFPCSIVGCSKPVLARGWCGTHYGRWRAHGDAEYPVRAQVNGSTLDRYWAKVDQSAGPTGCWLWTGGRQRYGIFWGGEHRADGAPIMVKAHRWTYEQFVGPIPDGIKVCHTCDNPPCVNLAHLFLGSQRDNVHDMMAKGRRVQPAYSPSSRNLGVANAAAKLTEAQVREIRARYAVGGVTQQAIADEVGVNQTIVSAIVRRKIWAHID